MSKTIALTNEKVKKFKVDKNWVAENYRSESVFIIPDGCTKICKNAFEGCETLEEIVLPTSIKYIGKGAFKDCHNLKRVNDIEFLYRNSTYIGKYAFKNCPFTDKYSMELQERTNQYACKKPTDFEYALVDFIACFFSDSLTRGFIIIIAALMTALISLLLLKNSISQEEYNWYADIYEKSSTYTCYINGTEVDINNINIEAYNTNDIKVDDDQHKILIRDIYVN